MPKEGRTRSSGRKKGGRAPRTGKTTTTRQTSNTFLTANSPGGGGGGGDDHEVSLDPSSGGGGGSSGSRNTSITRNVGELKERLQGRHRKSMTQLFFLVFVTLIIGAVTIALAYLFKPRNKGVVCNDKDILLPLKDRVRVPHELSMVFAVVVAFVSQISVDVLNWKQYKKTSKLFQKGDEGVKKHVTTMKILMSIKSFFMGLLNLTVIMMIVIIVAKNYGEPSPDFLRLCFAKDEDLVTECDKFREHPSLSPSPSTSHWPIYIQDFKCTRKGVERKELLQLSLDTFPAVTRAVSFSVSFFWLTYVNLQLKPISPRFVFLIWQDIIIVVTCLFAFADLGDNKHAIKDVGAALVISVVVSSVLYTFLHVTKNKELQDLERTIS